GERRHSVKKSNRVRKPGSGPVMESCVWTIASARTGGMLVAMRGRWRSVILRDRRLTVRLVELFNRRAPAPQPFRNSHASDHADRDTKSLPAQRSPPARDLLAVGYGRQAAHDLSGHPSE